MRQTNELTRLDRAFVSDPWSVYHRLRDAGPVQRAVLTGGEPAWLVTGHAEARALLADERLSTDYFGVRALLPGPAGPYESPLSAHMLNTDPPAHTRLRALVNQAFTEHTVARLRPRIEQIADDLLDRMSQCQLTQGQLTQGQLTRGELAEGEPADLIEDYAVTLPVTVICELLGVPAADRNDFRRWSKAIVSSVPPDVARESARSVSAYLTALIDAKRVSPADDLLSSLIHQTSEDGTLWPDELVRMAFLLLVAGLEKMVGLIGNGMLALLQHPRELARLRSEPGLMPTAIEEFLRYDGSIHIATVRFTTEPVRVAQTVIPADELVLISLLAANRDRDRYADPDVLDLSRPARGHLAFGHGVHYCVGAPLARLEGQIAIGRLLGRFPGLALAGPPGDLHWRGSLLVRSLSSLPVTLAAEVPAAQ
ncbi:MAG TPA: cytochrome P450 [Streptosporangiaceae bacterium]|nr:cytochrome P450 [Streptosporangiaceae bacterium]